MTFCILPVDVEIIYFKRLNSYATVDVLGNVGIAPVITFDKSKVSPGQLFDLNLFLSNVKSGDKTNSVVFYISYDNRAFETKTGSINVDCTDNPSYLRFIKRSQASVNVNVIQISFISETDVTLINNEKLITINFRAKSGATSGDKIFSILPVNMIDSSFNVYKFNDGNTYTKNLEVFNGAIVVDPTPTPIPTPIATPQSPVAQGNSSSQSSNLISTTIATTPTPISTTTPTLTPTPTSTPKASAEGNSLQSEKKSDIVIEPDRRIPGAGGFNDLENHWAQKAIMDLFTKDIISGYPDGSIKPNLEITRAEATTAIVKAIKLDISQKGEISFSDDIDIPDWARPYVKAASEKGFINGYEDKSFKPNNKVSRAEFVTMVINAFAFDKEKAEQLDFNDTDSIPIWSQNSILVALGMGIIHGYPDRTFRPQKNITRAEIFTVIWKCLNRK